MNKEEFLLDMLDYYTVDPEGRRCNSDGICFYSPKYAHKEGRSEGCAIGRHLPEDVAKYFDKLKGAGINSIFRDTRLLVKLPEWLSDLGMPFLNRCQQFHDIKLLWGEDIGLSSGGQNMLRDIISTFNLDKSKFEKYL